MEDCYILFSCDGSYDPIVSNYSGLNESIGSFINITITSPLTTPPTCFYVYYLGILDCIPTYDIIVNSTTGCTCNTLCYFVDYGEQIMDTTYVNNENELVIAQFETGQTANFCSKIFPVFEFTGSTKVKISNQCVGNTCPPTLSTIKRSNECDVLTIFPMSVECLIQNPTNNYTFDGQTQLYISGGTPPYTIFWEIGSYAPALTNLGSGSYSATVTDYYGDFTINTTCVLTAETLTLSAMCFVFDSNLKNDYLDIQPAGLKNTKPYFVITDGFISIGVVFWDELNGVWKFCLNFDCNPNGYYGVLDNNDGFYPISTTSETWSAGTSNNYALDESYLGPCNRPVIPVTYGNLCLFLLIRGKNEDPFEQIQVNMIYDGIVNGQPSWLSSGGTYSLIWNSGATPSQWVITGYSNNSTIVNYSSANPPLSNWQNFGDPTLYNVTVLSGSCSNESLVGFNVTTNDAICDSSGSILISPYGGTPPYQYSIDYGQSFQSTPYYQNLSVGTYGVMVVDSNGVSEMTAVSITSTPGPTYQLGFAYTIGGSFQVLAPVLPVGVSINFDLAHISILTYYPNTITPVPTYNNITTIAGVGPMSLYNTLNSFSLVTGPCSLVSPIYKNQQYLTYANNLSVTSSQIISGTTTNNVINIPTGQCQSAVGTYTLQIANAKVVGCDCCGVEIISF